jgi:hypothetical protein
MLMFSSIKKLLRPIPKADKRVTKATRILQQGLGQLEDSVVRNDAILFQNNRLWITG